MAETAPRATRPGEEKDAARAAVMPRLLLSSLILCAPAFLAFVGLAWFEHLAALPGFLAALFVYAGTLLLLYPLVGGMIGIRAAIERLTEDDRASPEVETGSQLVRDLWLAVGRWARSSRAKLRATADELDAARAVLAALPEPLLLLDEKRRVVRANAAAAALLGDRLLDRDLAGVLRQPPLLAAVDAVLRGEGERVVEFDMTSPVERHLGARLAPLTPHTAEGIAAVLLLNDLTALKRSEQLRADFVANASHELRTPLASLVGFIETLRGPARDDKAAGDRFLAIMAEQASRMRRLVEDLLSLSRIEMNEHQSPTGSVDIAGVVQAMADTLEQRAEGRGMRITLDLPDTLPRVLGDADELSQVFQNLIDNAIKYGATGTDVAVSAYRVPRLLPGQRGSQRAALAVAVRDHGAGIPREHLPRLTERFYRVDAARSRQLGGTGLGLAIVKHIVNHHRGILEIDSRMGEGSAFIVYLPIAPSPGSEPGLS